MVAERVLRILVPVGTPHILIAPSTAGTASPPAPEISETAGAARARQGLQTCRTSRPARRWECGVRERIRTRHYAVHLALVRLMAATQVRER